MASNELVSRVKEEQIKFISLQFTDVTGAVKSVDIPAHRLGEALREGVWFDGSSVEGFARIQERGWTYNVGPEPEFFLFKRNGPANMHPVPHDVGGYFDFSASDEAVRVRAELMLALSRMGLEVEMGHHEVALGQ